MELKGGRLIEQVRSDDFNWPGAIAVRESSSWTLKIGEMIH